MRWLNALKTYIKQHKALVLLFIAYIVIRLPILDHAFLLRGERDIVLTGYSLLKTGKDYYGNTLPLQFFGLDQPSPFLSFYYAALGWLIFPIKNIFFARLPFMLAGAMNVFLIYELIKRITKNSSVALVTSAIFAFSPGYYHLSLLALEINLAMPLLLLGMICYLDKKKLWGWVFLMLSFFAYNGFRPLIPFLVIYLEMFEYLKDGKFVGFLRRSFIAGIIFLVLFGLTYLFIDGDVMASRSGDLIFMNYEKITPAVDLRRNTADGPRLLKLLLNNKFTNTMYYMVQVFFEGQSLQYLFFRGDRAAIYTSTFAGQFFASTLVFYYLGFFALGKRLKREYLYVLGFIPVALIPSIVNIDYVSVAIRSLLASVSYAFIIAMGLLFALELMKKVRKHIRVLTYAAFLIIFAVEVGYFTYNYVFRWRIMMSESYFQHEKNVAEYLISADKKVTVYDDSPKNILTAYHIMNPDADIRELQAQLSKDIRTVENDKFVMYSCPQSGKKDVMYQDGTVIAESCLDPDEYQAVDELVNVERINFEDISTRASYFIYFD